MKRRDPRYERSTIVFFIIQIGGDDYTSDFADEVELTESNPISVTATLAVDCVHTDTEPDYPSLLTAGWY